MIYNEINKKDRNPTPKQNKYLLKIGSDREQGINYNGYGYSDTVRKYSLNRSQVIAYNKIGKEIKKVRKELTEDQKIEKWAKRLAKLAEINLKIAAEIANEKIEYKEQQINLVYERQLSQFSIKREKLINKMERENPLRRIIDSEHAQAIISASDRHNNTDYEVKLEEGREKREIGEVEDVKEYARNSLRIQS